MTAPRDAGDILMLGDSLIEYFDWQGRFPHARVRNMGISGETVQELFERLPIIIAEYPQTHAAFIMSGINNLAMEQPDFMPQYRGIISQLRRAYPSIRIHIHALLPTLLPWIDQTAIVRVNARLAALASEFDLTFIDMHDKFLGLGLRELLSEDGIHISAKGYEVWARELEPYIAADN